MRRRQRAPHIRCLRYFLRNLVFKLFSPAAFSVFTLSDRRGDERDEQAELVPVAVVSPAIACFVSSRGLEDLPPRIGAGTHVSPGAVLREISPTFSGSLASHFPPPLCFFALYPPFPFLPQSRFFHWSSLALSFAGACFGSCPTFGQFVAP
jgi:hypothetical protein